MPQGIRGSLVAVDAIIMIDPTMTKKLSSRAAKWLTANPGIINQLIELAADTDSYVSARIAKALKIPHPKIVKKIRGAPVTVDDDRLLKLRSEGLTYAAIGQLVGLGAAQVGNRLRKLKKENKKNEQIYPIEAPEPMEIESISE